jgi:DNA-binding transcriptional LysR family regulator
MELDLFRSFLAVADARSFTRAARSLHISQSALSRQIARMEKEIGTPLFERYGRHVECSRAGELLLPMARGVVRRGDDAVALVREQVTAARGAVRLGATAALLAHLLAPILASFVSAHPDVLLDVIEMDDGSVEEAIISGELDCAVATAWGPSRVATRHLLTEEILLVVPQGHWLAKYPHVRAEMLAKEPIVLPRGTMNAANVVIDALRDAGIEPKMAYRVGVSPQLTKAFVRQGMGVAPMPEAVIEPLDGLAALHFEKPMTRDVVLAYSRERQLSAAVRALMAYIHAGSNNRCSRRQPQQ